jgi:hypothetical protein
MRLRSTTTLPRAAAGGVPIVHRPVDYVCNPRADLGFDGVAGWMQGYDGEVGSRPDESVAVVRPRPAYGWR